MNLAMPESLIQMCIPPAVLPSCTKSVRFFQKAPFTFHPSPAPFLFLRCDEVLWLESKLARSPGALRHILHEVQDDREEAKGVLSRLVGGPL